MRTSNLKYTYIYIFIYNKKIYNRVNGFIQKTDKISIILKIICLFR